MRAEPRRGTPGVVATAPKGCLHLVNYSALAQYHDIANKLINSVKLHNLSVFQYHSTNVGALILIFVYDTT